MWDNGKHSWAICLKIIISYNIVTDARFGDVGFENKVAVAHAHISFQKKCSGLSARWIMMALWVPNVHHHSNIWFWQCYFVREWRTWEIIKGFYLGQKLFGSLQQLHNQMHLWIFALLLPTATVKVVDKSRINETYSLMKFSILSLSLSLLHDSKSTCIGVRESMQTAAHEDPWCPRKHCN